MVSKSSTGEAQVKLKHAYGDTSSEETRDRYLTKLSTVDQSGLSDFTS